MDALTALQARVSCPNLTAPAPNKQQLKQLELAAMRAADHGSMRPWRYLRIQGKDLHQLGQLFHQAAISENPALTKEQATRFSNMPLRAPFIYVAICRIQNNPKVPREEQLMAAACSVQNLITAAFSEGIGAYWRSGNIALNPVVKNGLGLTNCEEIIGFIYLGQPATNLKPIPNLNLADFFQNWRG